MRVQQPREESVGCLRTGEVHEVERTARSEHPPRFAKHLLLVRGLDVMKHHRGEHAIERGVGVGQRVREALVESHGRSLSFGLPSRAREGLRVGIEPDRDDARKGLADLQDQRARAASDVQDVVPGRERRLVDEHSASAVAAEQLRQRIVEGQEQIAAGRGKEVSVRPGLFAHVMQSEASGQNSGSPRSFERPRESREGYFLRSSGASFRPPASLPPEQTRLDVRPER